MSRWNDLVSKEDVVELLSESEQDYDAGMTGFEKATRYKVYQDLRSKVKEMPVGLDLEALIKQLEQRVLEQTCYGADAEARGIRLGLEISIEALKEANRKASKKDEAGSEVSRFIPGEVFYQSTETLVYNGKKYDGFYMTHQDTDTADNTKDVTAMVIGQGPKVFALYGDHSVELLDAAYMGGFEACLKYFYSASSAEFRYNQTNLGFTMQR